MLTNKHVIIALIVAPILAVIAYLATDAMVGEKPHKAEAGASYALVALPNCRYPSGHCTLKNNEFKIELTAALSSDATLTVQLTSAHPLQGAKMALVEQAANDAAPVDMVATDDSSQHWSVEFTHAAPSNSQLRVALAAADALYFGEAGLAFIHYQTSFGDDFRGDAH